MTWIEAVGSSDQSRRGTAKWTARFPSESSARAPHKSSSQRPRQGRYQGWSVNRRRCSETLTLCKRIPELFESNRGVWIVVGTKQSHHLAKSEAEAVRVVFLLQLVKRRRWHHQILLYRGSRQTP